MVGNAIVGELLMSDNVQKYENWRAITESDYVTMFIKTWFAFVATLREMYPKDNLKDVIGKGDKVYLTPYLRDFEDRYFQYNVIDKVKDNILKVYKLGRRYTLENKKYNRFFCEDFYELNKDFIWKKQTDNYECSISYDEDFVLSFHVKYLDEDFKINNAPLIITDKVDIADLVSSEHLLEEQAKWFIDDEAEFLNYFTTEIINKVSSAFIYHVTNGDFNSRYTSKVLARFHSITLSINADIVTALASMKDANVQKEDLLYYQSPCNNFIYKVEDGDDIPAIDTYKWFLNFVYFMRNALFHEIIDPLIPFWQEIFKHSYLVLKEILDGNINFFIEQEAIRKLIANLAWDEFSKKKDVYIPNYNENFVNGDLEIEFVEYSIDDSQIHLKANLKLNYWFDEYSQKQMRAVCRAIVDRKEMKKRILKIERTALQDI